MEEVGPGVSPTSQTRPGWRPDSLFNLERTLFAVFFMSDMSSSSSSFVSGEVEGVEGRHPGLSPLSDSQGQPLVPGGPVAGSPVLPRPLAKARPAPAVLGRGHSSCTSPPPALPCKEPPFLLAGSPSPCR